MTAKNREQVTKKVWLKECFHDGFIIPAKACKNCTLWQDYSFTKKDCKLLGYIEILPEQEKYLDKIIYEMNNVFNSEWQKEIHYAKKYEQEALKEIYTNLEKENSWHFV